MLRGRGRGRPCGETPRSPSSGRGSSGQSCGGKGSCTSPPPTTALASVRWWQPLQGPGGGREILPSLNLKCKMMKFPGDQNILVSSPHTPATRALNRQDVFGRPRWGSARSPARGPIWGSSPASEGPGLAPTTLHLCPDKATAEIHSPRSSGQRSEIQVWQEAQGRLLPASPSSRAPGGPQLVALLSSLAASTWVPGRPNAQQFQPDFFTSVTSAKTLIKIRSDSEVPGVVTWASFLAVCLFVCFWGWRCTVRPTTRTSSFFFPDTFWVFGAYPGPPV